MNGDYKNNNSQLVHVTRPLEPEKQEISPELAMKHQRSQEAYPYLKLSNGEYVIKATRRHPIGLFLPTLVGVLVSAVGFILIINSHYLSTKLIDNYNIDMQPGIAVALGLLLVLGAVLNSFASYFVFFNNKIFLTNESVIQIIQISLFSTSEQAVSLATIDDTAYRKNNLIEHMFDYGDIKISTIGNEKTYSMDYVLHPKEYTATLGHAVDAFKNGRAIIDREIVEDE